MKKIIPAFIILACGSQLKAQQKLKAIQDSVNLLVFKASPQFNLKNSIDAKTKLPELLAFNDSKFTLSVADRVQKASPDNMPVVVLANDSKMPVVRLNGNDNMPVAKFGGTNNDALIKLLKPTPPVKVQEALSPAPQK